MKNIAITMRKYLWNAGLSSDEYGQISGEIEKSSGTVRTNAIKVTAGYVCVVFDFFIEFISIVLFVKSIVLQIFCIAPAAFRWYSVGIKDNEVSGGKTYEYEIQ